MTIINFNADTVCHFSTLPKEAVVVIFGFLPSQALHTSFHVCSLWNHLINDENFPLIEWNKNKCEAGNDNLRRDIECVREVLQKSLVAKITEIFKKTSNPFSDRKRIVDCIFAHREDYILSLTAWRSATNQGCLPLCEAFFPLVKGDSALEQGICHAIQQGHIELVKRLLPELHEGRAKEKICIRVQYPTKEGESLSLRGYIGVGAYDLNSWEKGFPMKKVRDTDDLWEIILLPVIYSETNTIIYGKTTTEYFPKDHILFPFKPILHLANGETWMSKDKYHVKPRTDITIIPQFQAKETVVNQTLSDNDF
jgi:hypothetical protein